MCVNVWVNSMFNVWYGTDGWMGTPDMTWVMDDASVRDAGGARGRTNTTTVMVMVMVTTSSCSGSGVAAVRTRTTTRLSRRSSSSSVASSHHRGRRCARSAGEIGETTTNDGEDDEAAKKKWKPKPLPSTFGDTGSVKKKSPFDATTGATSPFERKPTPAGKPDGSPFGAAAAAADKPASPFGAVAATTTTTPAGKKPESPFGAAEARSPFAPAPGAAATKSPFGGSSAAKNPFNEPDAALYGSKPVVKEPEVKAEEKKSVWESMPKPSLGQVVIVLSFTTIISLMLGTFYVVFQAGGVHFNDS